jgi:prepilin-type processing-associated H-X9-DG protein
MPGLGKARAMAYRLRCASNLKQIDLALRAYMDRNNDTYPSSDDPNYVLWPGRKWRSFVAPYLGGNIDANNPSVLLCPSDKIAPQKWESTSYSYSMAFYHSPEQIDSITDDLIMGLKPEPQRSVSVARPSGKILIGEWLSNHQKVEQADDGWWCWLGRRNYLFADGQVRFLWATEIRPANDINPATNKGNPNPNLTINGIRGIDWPR